MSSYSTKSGSYRYIYGLKWYYILVPKEQEEDNTNNTKKTRALFLDYPRNSLLNKFLVCWDFMENGKTHRFYSVFNSFLDFAKFFINLPKHHQSFYEIVLGENLQKIHFDLDMELGDDLLNREPNKDSNKDSIILNDLMNAIVFVLKEKNIELDLRRQVCIYTSHGISNGKEKKSYHIVINGYCHANNKEAKAFYYCVMEKLPKEYMEKKWIDSAVYSKTQQFRTYGSCKAGTTRFKKLLRKWTFNGETIVHLSPEVPENEDHEFIINFEESLVTARASNCKIVPGFEVSEEYIRKTFVSSDTAEIDKELAWEAFCLLANKAGTTPDDPKFPYRYSHLEGSIVALKRVKPSKCKICNRIHEHENPYILIIPDTKHVYFHCRRAPPDKKLYLGCLKTEEEIEEEKLKKIEIEKEEEKLEKDDKGKEEENEFKDEDKKDEKGKEEENEYKDECKNDKNNDKGKEEENECKDKKDDKDKEKKEKKETNKNWSWTQEKIEKMRQIAAGNNPIKKKKYERKVEDEKSKSFLLNKISRDK